MQQSSLAVPSLQGPNLAPQLDESKRATPKEQKPFPEWVKETTARLERTNQEIWRELHLVWMLVNLYIEGKQMLRKRHRGFGFDVIPYPDTTAASVREQNKLGFYSRALMAKWVSSRTKVEATGADDTEEAQEASRVAECLLDALQEDIYGEVFRQREAIGGQVCGAYARYFYYDEGADGGYTKEPILDEQQVKLGDDIGACLECGYSGSANEFISPAMPSGDPARDALNAQFGHDEVAEWEAGTEAPHAPEAEALEPPEEEAEHMAAMSGAACPQCGSTLVQIDEMPAANVVNIAGYQDRKVGKICGKTVPYTRIRHEIAQSPEDSPWMRWKERVRLEEIKAAYPGVKVGIVDSAMRDSGLEVEDTMQRLVGGYQNTAMLGYWSKDREQYGEVTHWWLTPPMYSEYIFPIDTETQSGTIPAGTKATDIFPDGMHFVMISGCDQSLMLENDCHRDHWVSAPYHLRFLAGTGIGINDSVEMQRQFNVVLGLIFTQIRTAALPGWMYDKDAVSPDEVRKLGQPQMSVPVSLRNRADGTRIEQLVHQMQPGQVPSHLFNYVSLLDANMQTTAGVLDFSNGLPGVDNKTATGAQIASSMAQGHNAPEFALKGDADVRSAKVMLKLAKRYYDAPRFVANAGKYGKQGGQWFSAIDLDEGKIRLQAKKDSWLPNSRLQKQEGIEKVLTLAGGIPGLLQLQEMAPDLLEQIEEAYDITIRGDSFNANALLCRQRIDQLKKLVPQFEQMAQLIAPMVDPMSGMPIDPIQMIAGQILQGLQPPVVPEEPGHNLSINLLRQWLVTDEGKEASPMMRGAVIALIHAHIEASILEAQVQGQAQIASQMPEMQMQASMQAGQQAQKTDADMRKESARANFKMQAGQSQPPPKPKAAKQQ